MRVTERDIRAIAAHLELSEAGFRARYLAASGDRLVEGLGPACVFLRDGSATGCGIYPVRPEKCRTWPFWDELRDDPAALQVAMSRCPGIEPGGPTQPDASFDEDCSS